MLVGTVWSQSEGPFLGRHFALTKVKTKICPITIESWRRVFAPMLACLGPKYASTADCFMRVLQLYGSTVDQAVDQLLDPEFSFATVERLDVSVPLIDKVENLTADAGGEAHKKGGVIDTTVPHASWQPIRDRGVNRTHASRSVILLQYKYSSSVLKCVAHLTVHQLYIVLYCSSALWKPAPVGL